MPSRKPAVPIGSPERMRRTDWRSPGRGSSSEDLDTWTREELFARAEQIELPGRHAMTRRQLIDELRRP
jgi:hypothetical protein